MIHFLRLLKKIALLFPCLFSCSPLACVEEDNLDVNRGQKIVITGANGWIGYNAYKALKDYQLIMVDHKIGNDSTNRFGIEGVDQTAVVNLRNKIIKIDLATNLGSMEFEELLAVEKPDCVLHLAAILENQHIEEIKKNDIITTNVLDVCAKLQIKLIAASSIMVMFGAAVRNQAIKEILFGNTQERPIYQLSVDDEFENSEEAISQFGTEKNEQHLGYIKTKE